jgi:hypothetical protein
VRGGDEDDHDSEEDREVAMQKVLASVDMNRLEKWLEKVYPKVSQILEANLTQRAFDSYEVLWEEERDDIKEVHALKTDFDFFEANKAV